MREDSINFGVEIFRGFCARGILQENARHDVKMISKCDVFAIKYDHHHETIRSGDVEVFKK